jgi:diacylglycerol kinase family enzyme
LSIWVVINPHAAELAGNPNLVEAVRRHAGPLARVRVTDTFEQLGQVAEEALGAGARRVVLCGGDGTYMAGVSALATVAKDRPLPEVTLAPGGTVGTVARSFRQSRDLLSTVRRATRDSADGDTTRTPTLSVTDDSGRVRMGFIFGTGLVARFFDRYYSGRTLGYAAAARIVARVLVGSFVADAYSRSVLDPLPCELRVDGRTLDANAFSLVLASVIRDVGLHMLVCHRAGEDPQRPHLVASSLPPRTLGPQLHRVLVGRGLRDPHGFDDLVREVRVTFPDSGPYVLDGDLLHAKHVDVKAGVEVLVRSYR